MTQDRTNAEMAAYEIPQTLHFDPALELRNAERVPVISLEAIDEAAERFEGVEQTMALLEWVVETFPQRWILASSWQHAIIVDHLAKITGDVRVFELDTELLFRETYETRRRIVERYRLQVTSMRARESVAEQAVSHGSNLWERDPDLCCKLRKVIPMRQILAEQDAWLTGLRREQASTRKHARVVEYDRKHGMVKINPLACWTNKQVWRYIFDNDVPYNPLQDKGYPSIGCFPCTRPVKDGQDSRDGRWTGSAKTECGIHS